MDIALIAKQCDGCRPGGHMVPVCTHMVQVTSCWLMVLSMVLHGYLVDGTLSHALKDTAHAFVTSKWYILSSHCHDC